MQPILSVLKRHSLLIGVFLMYAFSWLLELASAGYIHLPIPPFLSIFNGYGVTIAALLMTAVTLGRSGVAALLKRLVIWRVGWQWYLVALFLLPAIALASVIMNAALTGTPLDFSTVVAHSIFGASASLPLFVVPFFLVDLLSNGEELGWRGYVLPRLQSRYGALASALILGAIWWLWHLPLFAMRGTLAVYPWFLPSMMVQCVVYSWLFNNTRGSVLLVALMHASGNTAGAFLPAGNSATAATQGALLFQIAITLVVAVLVVLATGPATLSRTEPKQVAAPAPAL